MKAMSNKGFGNRKAAFDNGYGLFLKMLEYLYRLCYNQNSCFWYKEKIQRKEEYLLWK